MIYLEPTFQSRRILIKILPSNSMFLQGCESALNSGSSILVNADPGQNKRFLMAKIVNITAEKNPLFFFKNCNLFISMPL
jgi:hypothetical protein